MSLLSKSYLLLISILLINLPIQAMEGGDRAEGLLTRTARASQNFCYNLMARTCWDSIVSGFQPGRRIALYQLNIQRSDRILFIGEGTGLDFEVLPEGTPLHRVQALDFSPQMVAQAKRRAVQIGIPERNCFVADAQALPFTDERFDKIYFPLSLGSIPNPHLALREAERVLAADGVIVLFEKLVDDGYQPSLGRRFLNFITQFVFANINRNLTQMMGIDSPLRIVHYQSLKGRFTGCFASLAAPYYRIATLVRINEHRDLSSVPAQIRRP